MKTGKKVISLVLCFIMLIGTVAISGDGFAELLDVFSVKASATDYNVGDIIEFGTYPQTDVTDEMGDVLNTIEGVWKSYNYYSSTGDWADGQMTASDYMRYMDVSYKDVTSNEVTKYRAVTFDSYRANWKVGATNADSTFQDNNGYTTGNVYWFKYEPIKWRVLDPSTGLVMCDSVIDSQAYNNYILCEDSEYWGDPEKTYRANDYANSSIRQWLNNDFYNTVFSDDQKSNILVSNNLNNTCPYNSSYDSSPTSDKIFLLSYKEVANSAYGFDPAESFDRARTLQGSDYAKCQGLYVYGLSDGEYSNWWLRSPYSRSDSACLVSDVGKVNSGGVRYVHSTCYGVVPGLKLKNLKSDSIDQTIDIPESPATIYKLPVFDENSVAYKTVVTVEVILNSIPEGAEVFIDGKPAQVSVNKYSVKLGQLSSDKKVNIEVIKNGETLDSSTLTINVDNSFFSKLISFFSNFLFNLFKWREVTVEF